MFNVHNACQFEGRMAKDPTFSTVGQGQNAFNKATFTIAVDRQLSKTQREAKKNGQDVVTADFPQFVAIGGKADLLQKYFHKGKPIKIWASYQSYVTQDAAGNKKYGHIFQVEELGFTLSDNSNGNGGGNGAANNNGNSNGGYNNNGGGNGYANNNNGGGYNNNAGGNRGGYNNAAPTGAAPAGDFYDISDDDIPF